jgi:hypothetical protein
MNDRDDRLKQAIRQAPHPGLRPDFMDQTIARITNGKHTDQQETLTVQGSALLFGMLGSATRRRWMIITALVIAAALSVQAIQTMNAEDELLELDTLSMSSLLAL